MLKFVMQSQEREDELALAQRMLGTDSPEQTRIAALVQACVCKRPDLVELRLCLNDVVIREEIDRVSGGRGP